MYALCLAWGAWAHKHDSAELVSLEINGAGLRKFADCVDGYDRSAPMLLTDFRKQFLVGEEQGETGGASRSPGPPPAAPEGGL